MLLRGSRWAAAAAVRRRSRCGSRRLRRRGACQPSPPTRSGSRPTPARELVLGWIDGEGYDGANRAMRSHVFDPAGYPEDVPVTIAWGERDRLVGPPKPRPPPRRRPLPRPPRRRPHPDLGRPRAGRPDAARGQRKLGRSRLTADVSEFTRTLGVNLRHPQRERGAAVIIERTENPMWLSNAYLVADPEPRHRRADRRQRRAGAAAGAGRARRDRDHPRPRHPPPRRPHRRPGRGARRSSATRRWSPTEACAAELDDEVAIIARRRRQARRRRPRGRSASTPPATPPATSPSSSTAPTSSPPTSSSRARSAARWPPAPAASPTSRPR